MSVVNDTIDHNYGGKMKRKLFGLILATSLVVSACQGNGGSSSATKSGQASTAGSAAVTESKTASTGSQTSSTGSQTSSAASGSSSASSAKEGSTASAGTEEGTEKFPSFETTDTKGNKVTEKIFADKDITMVNVWGTFCGPCINEMPELQKIYESLPKNANLIGIVADVPEGMKDGVDNANYIEKQTGVKYTNLTLSDSLGSFARRFYAVPSTIFVDKNGNIIGELVMGADIDAYVRNLQNVLTDWKYES